MFSQIINQCPYQTKSPNYLIPEYTMFKKIVELNLVISQYMTANKVFPVLTKKIFYFLQQLFIFRHANYTS